MKEPPPYSRSDPDRACRDKIKWETHSEASEAAWWQQVDFGEVMEPYHCPHCAHWHTGNIPLWLTLDREYGVYDKDKEWPNY